MASEYYKPCKELEQCEALDQYWEKKQFDKFFKEYLKIAEETSYPLAQCQVGFCYLEGIGVERNFEKAFYWCLLAAEQGDWDAQYNLASMYEDGLYVEKDLEKAKHWYLCAANQGHKLAMKKIVDKL